MCQLFHGNTKAMFSGFIMRSDEKRVQNFDNVVDCGSCLGKVANTLSRLMCQSLFAVMDSFPYLQGVESKTRSLKITKNSNK